MAQQTATIRVNVEAMVVSVVVEGPGKRVIVNENITYLYCTHTHVGISTGIAKLDRKNISSATYKIFFLSLSFVKYIHITTCLGKCQRTDAYFCFATNAEKGQRQGDNNST